MKLYRKSPLITAVFGILITLRYLYKFFFLDGDVFTLVFAIIFAAFTGNYFYYAFSKQGAIEYAKEEKVKKMSIKSSEDSPP